MAQQTREREQEQTSQTSGEDMVEVWVHIHQTDITVPIMVRRGADVHEVLAAIQAYYADLGETLKIAGSQVLLNDNTYIIDADGKIHGDFTYKIYQNATLTLTREISGGEMV